MSIHEPFAEELILGVPLPAAPAITLTDGLAAQYQAITGDALRVPLSAPLSHQVTGAGVLANPALVLQVAIGQSTVATRRVIANLFYRHVRILRQVPVGTTLETTVTPKAARLARPNAAGDRAKVLLSMTTRDEAGNIIADFERLALIPVRHRLALTEAGETGAAEQTLDLGEYIQLAPADWNLAGLPTTVLPPAGTEVQDPLREPVTEAQSLVRITQNLAAAHRDTGRGQQGRRLVYGGHTVGLAQAALSRIDPSIATVLGWHSCDHLAPVFEEDLLSFTTVLEDSLPHKDGSIAAYRITATAHRPGAEPVDVLSWVPVVWTAAETKSEGKP
ncbi:hypothetical protein ARGLB_037_01240 [Arthrobacter globiformis NBRC 12137]|uniref:Acyl dehydratase n=1 Tax=Arthrobacter globiformis (strain ATCC 8010 / DSM 20124 / JCM 1332 / NBRC 12137 / NCIMB 8907 / NRRL B-2979 / 168) TaxID=1077972 RepID=H0QK33_ARTG1|nr:hypothetical protein [Arthrobacter globiformis]GAB13273.1 hypothetical protein ARGLB_037_01240 [Arthrobacter globiformis NBRC 12137]